MLAQALLGELQFEAENTRKLFNVIEADFLTYKPHEHAWTMSELLSHISEVYNWFDVTLNIDVFEMSEYKYDKGDISSVAGLQAKLEENIATAVRCLTDYEDAKLFNIWTMQMNGKNLMPPGPRIQMVRGFLMNHLYHHRGEVIAYLRANGKPIVGLYGPTYEETKAMSM